MVEQRREFLGDEIHLMASDITILRQENDLLRMTSERKAEENALLRAELTELKTRYEERVTEAVAIRTILENVVLNVSAGLNRYRARRDLKQEHVEEPPIERLHPGNSTGRPAPAPVQAAPLEKQPRIAAPTPRPPVPRVDDEPVEPPPAFLRRTDDRIPNNDFVSDDDNLRELHQYVGGRKEGQ